MSDRLKALSDAGVSIWLDDLSRERIETGNLAELVKSSSVVGVTTNPTIFASALADGERYDAQLGELVAAGRSVDDAIFELTTTDVRDACDVLADVFRATDGVDGRVSIEVPPGLAVEPERGVLAVRDEPQPALGERVALERGQRHAAHPEDLRATSDRRRVRVEDHP